MGCLVSRQQINAISTVNTPRLKSSFEEGFTESGKSDRTCPTSTPLDLRNEKPDPKPPTKPNGLNFKRRRTEADIFANIAKEQLILHGTVSNSKNKKKILADGGGGFMRSLSNRPFKDTSFADFSFKNSIDSSREKDIIGTNSPRSSTQNFENASNQSVDSSNKFEIAGSGNFLRRTATPNFSNKPSSFLLERRNSLRNLRVSIESLSNFSPNTSIIPMELHTEQRGAESNGKIEQAHKKSQLMRFSLLEGNQDALKNENINSDKPDESTVRGLKDWTVPQIKSGNSSRLHKQTSLEQSLSNDTDRGSLLSHRRNSLKNGQAVELETNIVKIRPSHGSEQQSLKNLSEKQKENSDQQSKPQETPDLRLNLKALSSATKNGQDTLSPASVTANSMANLRIPMPGQMNQKSFPTPKRHHLQARSDSLQAIQTTSETPTSNTVTTFKIFPSSAKASEKNKLQLQPTDRVTESIFGVIRQLTVQDKFTKNLLDVLKDHSDDLSPVLPLHHARKQRNKLLSGKSDLNGSKNSPKSSGDSNGNRTVLSSNSQTGGPHTDIIVISQMPVQQKLIRKGTGEALPGSIHSNNSQFMAVPRQLPDQESYLTVNTGNNQRSQMPQTMRTEYSMLDNKTIYNLEDNISMHNITKYVFNCENEEIEYDEANGINNLNKIKSNILGGLGQDDSPSHMQREGLSPNRLDSSLNRESIGNASSPGKETIYKGSQPELHLQFSNDDGSPGGSRSEGRSPQTLSLLKIDSKANPHRPLKNSVFCNESSSPNHPRAQTIAQPFGGAGITRGLQKTKSWVVPKSHEMKEAKEEEENGGELTRLVSGLASFPGAALQQIDSNSNADKRPPERSYTRDLHKPARSQGPSLRRTSTMVIETNKLDKTKDEEGQKGINNYLLIKDLGRGSFGKVKLAKDRNTDDLFAVKVANKKKLKQKMLGKIKGGVSPLASEIAIMKKLDHPNIVKLWEVIDDPREEKLYLVMDFVRKGAVMSDNYWKYEDNEAKKNQPLSTNEPEDKTLIDTDRKRPLSEEKALKYFRGLVLGLDYLHNYAHVIHRDIKPENLLIDHEDNLKISDFGVSYIMEDSTNDFLKNNAGTKCFLPPEAFAGKGFHGGPADIWAAGATLYYFMTARPPFEANNAQELKARITSGNPVYPPDMNPKLRMVIESCLQKDPAERATLSELMTSEWLTENGMFIVENRFEFEKEFAVSDQDVISAMTGLSLRSAIRLTVKMKKKLNATRKHIEEKKTLILDDKSMDDKSPHSMKSLIEFPKPNQ